MRILYVLEHYHPYIGGAEKLFRNVAESMVANGHQATVITTRYDMSLPAEETVNGVRIQRIRCYNRYLFTLFAALRLLGLKERFDIVHATTYNAAFPAWIYAKLRRTPSVLTFHEVWGSLWFELPFLSLLERWGYYLYEKLILNLEFDRYIAVSHYTANCLREHGIADQKIRTIYNGVEYPERLPETPKRHHETFELVYFGRLGVSKGLDLLIPAVHKLHSEGHDILLHLVIPRKPYNMLKKVISLVQEHPNNEHIEVYHELTDNSLRSLILSSDAVVIPSYSEGFCFVAAEACALEKPIIHSGRGALEEVVSGTQIQMTDMDIDSMCEAINSGLNDHWQTGPIRKFSLSNSIKKYLELYQEVYLGTSSPESS